MNTPDNPSQAFSAQLAAPALVALVVVAVLQPFVAIAVSNLPLRLDDATWRLRVAALILGAAPQIGVGLAVIGSVGAFAGMRRALRCAAIIALLFGIVLIPLLAFDALDVLQVRHIVQDDRRRAFDLNALQTAGLGALMIPIMIWAGWRGILASKRTEEQLVEATVSGGLVVVQHGTTPATKTITPSR